MSKHFRSWPYLLCFSISYLALGVSLPAMSLIVTSKGFPLPYLGLVLFIYSITVMVFELPSGVFADAKGKKLSFFLGTLFSLVGTLFLFTRHFALICVAFAFSGFGRALGSGSLDALYIEDGQRSGSKLEDLVFSLDLVSGLGLSLGSLLGGYLLKLGGAGETLTHPMLLVRGFLLLLVLLCSSLSIKEARVPTMHDTAYIGQLKTVVRILRDTPFLAYFSLSVLVQGLLLSSLESYWQPFLKQLLVDDLLLWILGVVSALIFAISILGSLFGKLLLRYVRPLVLYCVLFCTICILQIILALQEDIYMFIVLFCCIYLLIGMLSVVGMFILNKTAKDEVRSSLLSLSSFSLQTGGVVSNLSATFILGLGGIALFWKVSSVVGLIILLLLAKPLLQRFPST